MTANPDDLRNAPGTAPGESGQAGELAITHFNFMHKVFQTPGARFLMKGVARIPTFRVDMGDLEALIEIDVLKKEFGLAPDSHDGKLVDMAMAGLRYVPDIKPGDTIPSEILTGKASWAVSPKHRKVAEQRLQVQLLSWVSGKELLLTDPTEIATFLEQIENREKLRNAFKDAAKALGLKPENTDPVLKQLELLARELNVSDRVRFVGYVPNISPWLEQCRVFLLSSYYEGYGAVILEALARGRPVVCTDCSPAVGDLIRGIDSCSVAPIGDQQALALALEQALFAAIPDPAALAKAVEPYRLGPIAVEYLDLFDRAHIRRVKRLRLSPRIPDSAEVVA